MTLLTIFIISVAVSLYVILGAAMFKYTEEGHSEEMIAYVYNYTYTFLG